MSPAQLARIHALGMTIPAPWTERDFKTLLSTDSTFLVTTEETGFALGRVILDEAELLTLVVMPDMRRHGLGRTCLQAFEDTAAHRGAARLFLEVADTNEAAKSLYHSSGWAVVGRRKAYYKGDQTRIDAILMEKHLRAD